jgi:myo-inositol-1(or 4)-monophosphatase
MFVRSFKTKSPLINMMAGAAFQASRVLLRDFGELMHLQTSKKGPQAFGSVADRRAERILYETLYEAYPDTNFLMEESGEINHGPPDAPLWIIDPIDGTNNFLHGIPHFCMAIAYQEQGVTTAGIIFDPIKDEMFWTVKGMGAYLNQIRLRVSLRQSLHNCLLGTQRVFPLNETAIPLVQKAAGIRVSGSTALDLAYVASGRYDGFFGYNTRLLDVAAGLLMIRESGGFSSVSQGTAKCLFAGNEAVYRALQDVVKEA